MKLKFSIGLKTYFFLVLAIVFFACESEEPRTPEETLRGFITTVKEKNEEAAWKFMTREAQYHYESEGLRSGRKGIDELRREIGRVVKVKEEGADYRITKDPSSRDNLVIEINDSLKYLIEMYNPKGTAKIKDGKNVVKIFEAVTEKNNQ